MSDHHLTPDEQLKREAADVRQMLGLSETALSGDVYRALSAITQVGVAAEDVNEEVNDTRIEAISSSLNTFPSDWAYRTSSDLGYWVCTARDLVQALKVARSWNDALTQQRDYGRDIINDMTIEVHDAAKRIAELEMQLQSAVTAIPGVTLLWVEPSTTTSQPGYYTPVYSSSPGVTVSFGAPAISRLTYDAHGGTSHLPALCSAAASPKAAGRPFADLVNPLPDGSIPAVEVAKLAFGYTDAAPSVKEMFDKAQASINSAGRAHIAVGPVWFEIKPNFDVAFIDAGCRLGPDNQVAIVDYLRANDFLPAAASPVVEGGGVVEGVKYFCYSRRKGDDTYYPAMGNGHDTEEGARKQANGILGANWCVDSVIIQRETADVKVAELTQPAADTTKQGKEVQGEA